MEIYLSLSLVWWWYQLIPNWQLIFRVPKNTLFLAVEQLILETMLNYVWQVTSQFGWSLCVACSTSKFRDCQQTNKPIGKSWKKWRKKSFQRQNHAKKVSNNFTMKLSNWKFWLMCMMSTSEFFQVKTTFIRNFLMNSRNLILWRRAWFDYNTGEEHKWCLKFR